MAYLALFGAAHYAVRRWMPYADPLILPCVAVLNGLGLVMIDRLDLAGVERMAQGGPAPLHLGRVPGGRGGEVAGEPDVPGVQLLR